MGRYGATAAPLAWRNPRLNDFALAQSIDFSGLADTAAMSAALEAKFPNFFNLGNVTLDTTNTLDGHPTMRVPAVHGNPYGEAAPFGVDYTRMWFRPAILVPADAASTGTITFGEVHDDPDYSTNFHGRYDLANSRWLVFNNNYVNGPSQSIAELKGTWVYPVYRFDSDGTAVLFLNGLPAQNFASSGVTQTFDTVSLFLQTTSQPFNIGLYEFAIGDNPYELADPGTYEPTITLEPAEWLVAASGTKQFAAFADGLPIAAASVTWGGTGGSVSAGGLYTAGAVEGVFAVTASYNGGDASAPIEVGDFTPADLSPWAWHDFDDLAGANDDPITEIEDKGGNPVRSLSGAQGVSSEPTLKTNVLNGHDVAEGDGANDFMRYTVGVPWEGRTTFFIGRMISVASGGDCIFAGAEGGTRIIERLTGWQLTQVNDEGGIATTVLGGDRTAWTVFALRYNSTTSLTVWRNNQQFDITLNGDQWDRSAISNHFLRFFSHESPSDNANAQIGPIVHDDSILSDADVARVRRWYNAYAGGVY
jgi:hypothetical protein